MHCGYASAYAQAWLQKVWAQTKRCRLVWYTVITNGYDVLHPVTGSDAADECHVVFVDEATRALVSGHTNEWLLLSLPDPPAFDSSSRVAHSMKAAAMRLFPSAEATLYTDGKVKAITSLGRAMARFRNLTRKAYVVIKNFPGASTSLAEEFASTERRLCVIGRRNPEAASHLAQDFADLAKQRALYEAEGRYSDHPGAIDAAVIAQFRAAHSTPQSGGDDPAPSTLIRWLECAWFNEIAMHS